MERDAKLYMRKVVVLEYLQKCFFKKCTKKLQIENRIRSISRGPLQFWYPVIAVAVMLCVGAHNTVSPRMEGGRSGGGRAGRRSMRVGTGGFDPPNPIHSIRSAITCKGPGVL